MNFFDEDKIDSMIDETFEDIGEVYSNFDHELNKDIAEKLKTGEYHACHSAWNFHGRIVYVDGKYIERVRSYCSTVGFYLGKDILAVIDMTNKLHGND